MKKIKDMTQSELERIVAKVVFHSTDQYDAIIKTIGDDFTKIKAKIEYEMAFPNTAKQALVKQIDSLVEKLSKIYKSEKDKQ